MLIKIARLPEENTPERDNVFQSTHYLYNECAPCQYYINTVE